MTAAQRITRLTAAIAELQALLVALKENQPAAREDTTGGPQASRTASKIEVS